MKIFFIPGAYDGCYYYRGYLPGVYSESMVCSNFVGKKFDGEEMYEKAMKADCIVIGRPNDINRYELAKALKLKGKKIIVENDDTYLPDKGIPLNMLANDKQREIAKKMNDYIYSTIRIADGVIASTYPLAEEFKQVNSNTRVMENSIDPLDEMPCKENTTGKFRIAFIGSVSSNNDYEHIKEQIKQLDERGDVTIIVFGVMQPNGGVQGAYMNDYVFWKSLKNIEFQPFVPIDQYYMTLADLAIDLAIIPRKEGYFNQCKSNLKFLEMSLLHIPVVAQGFKDGTSPYQGKDEKYMSIVIDNEMWYHTVINIKNNYTKYKELADLAHDYVIKNYNINEYAPKWRYTIEKLCSSKKS